MSSEKDRQQLHIRMVSSSCPEKLLGYQSIRVQMFSINIDVSEPPEKKRITIKHVLHCGITSELGARMMVKDCHRLLFSPSLPQSLTHSLTLHMLLFMRVHD